MSLIDMAGCKSHSLLAGGARDLLGHLRCLLVQRATGILLKLLLLLGIADALIREMPLSVGGSDLRWSGGRADWGPRLERGCVDH